MRTDAVPCGQNLLNKFGVLAYTLTDEEESRGYVETLEHLESLKGKARIGPVVKGQRNGAGITTEGPLHTSHRMGSLFQATLKKVLNMTAAVDDPTSYVEYGPHLSETTKRATALSGERPTVYVSRG